MRSTTKVCDSCGSESLVHLRSMNVKICGVCKTEMPWFLEEGQKPLIGPSRQLVSDKAPEYAVQFDDLRDRLWIHASDGSTVARFSRFGIDIHRTVTEQQQGLGQCLYCTHQPATIGDWHIFRAKVLTQFGVELPADAIDLAILKPGGPSEKH